MKLEDLKAIREKASAKLEKKLQDVSASEWKIVVSMGTTGILYGAREILAKLIEVVNELELNVLVTQSGSFGLDSIEPVCAIYQGDKKVVYGNLKPEMIKELLETHVVKGEILNSYRVVVPGDVGNKSE